MVVICYIEALLFQLSFVFIEVKEVFSTSWYEDACICTDEVSVLCNNVSLELNSHLDVWNKYFASWKYKRLFFLCHKSLNLNKKWLPMFLYYKVIELKQRENGSENGNFLLVYTPVILYLPILVKKMFARYMIEHRLFLFRWRFN